MDAPCVLRDDGFIEPRSDMDMPTGPFNGVLILEVECGEPVSGGSIPGDERGMPVSLSGGTILEDESGRPVCGVSKRAHAGAFNNWGEPRGENESTPPGKRGPDMDMPTGPMAMGGGDPK